MQEERNREDYNTEVDEYSCLFLDKFKLHRAHCPFEVVCTVDNLDFKPEDKVEVTQVTYSHEKVILFQVFGKMYPHFYFKYIPPTQLVITKLS